MEENDKPREKIVVNKRVKATKNSVRRHKDVNLNDDNPLLSQAPSNSVAAQMLSRSNAQAERQNKISEEVRKANGIIEERFITTNNTDDSVHKNSFISSIIDRFK